MSNRLPSGNEAPLGRMKTRNELPGWDIRLALGKRVVEPTEPSQIPGPVTLGPNNYGYQPPANPGDPGPRPNPLEGLTQGPAQGHPAFKSPAFEPRYEA